MKNDQLKSFIDAIYSDPALQAKLTEESTDPIALAASLGFTISEEDINGEIEAKSDELSQQELESVAGGGNLRPLGARLKVLQMTGWAGGTCGCPTPPSGIRSEKNVSGKIDPQTFKDIPGKPF